MLRFFVNQLALMDDDRLTKSNQLCLTSVHAVRALMVFMRPRSGNGSFGRSVFHYPSADSRRYVAIARDKAP
jgi:hypothetical protein